MTTSTDILDQLKPSTSVISAQFIAAIFTCSLCAFLEYYTKNDTYLMSGFIVGAMFLTRGIELLRLKQRISKIRSAIC